MSLLSTTRSPPEMGFRTVGEMVGRADMLEVDQEVRWWWWGAVGSNHMVIGGWCGGCDLHNQVDVAFCRCLQRLVSQAATPPCSGPSQVVAANPKLANVDLSKLLTPAATLRCASFARVACLSLHAWACKG